MANGIILVVTGTHEQYLRYCKMQNLKAYHDRARYVSMPESVRGLNPEETEVVFYGTYNERRDILAIFEELLLARLWKGG